MGGEAGARLGAAELAMAAGDVPAAVAALREAIELADLPEAHRMLGGLCYFDDDFDGARRELELAFQGFRARGDDRTAARVAADLAELHNDILANAAAGRGWLARATRLLGRQGRCVERGYVALALIACERSDVLDLERSAAEALELAIDFADHALEVRALADSGYALVSQGRTAEGFARLDEAMAALSAGEVHDRVAAGRSYCAMLSACDRAGAVRRAEEWTRLITERVIQPAGGRPRVLHTHCRLAYGSVLCTVGRWSDAEAALLDALGADGSASLGHRADAAARLAHLRVLQGRLEEAAELLAPFEDRVAACAPLAMLHIARGERDLAAAAISRGLDQLVGDRFREAELLALLVEVELQRDVDRAGTAAARLAEVARGCGEPGLLAEQGLALGRVAAARGEHGEAAGVLADALRHLDEGDRPVLGGTIRVERAQALAAAGDLAGAVSEARAALSAFERLGATSHVDRTAALLRSLGAPGRPRTAGLRQAVDALTARERDVLDLLRLGLTNAEIGSRLFISPKTVEHHVGRVLAKLGVRSRAEAAAVAAAASATSSAT